jgi:5-methylcytosine-specific restriction endonuclease McrA
VTRRRISTKERKIIFERNGRTCHMCGGLIQIGDAWEVSHEIPLKLGGDDEGDNLKPAHKKCHRDHTAAVDIPNIARAKRREASHIGAKQSRNPMPGSRASKWKRKMNGEIVRR